MRTSMYPIVFVVACLVYPQNVSAEYPSFIDLAHNPGIPITRILGEYPSSYLGHELDYGDFNNDGYPDIITGAFRGSPEDLDNAGVAYIIWGGESLDNTDTIDLAESSEHVLQYYGIEIGEQLGVAVSSGDINGDGIDDAILGAWHKDGFSKFDCGAVYVYFGNTNLDTVESVDLAQPQGNMVTIYGPDAGYVIYDDNPYYASVGAGSNLGISVDAGDINGDGCDDLLLGTYSDLSPYSDKIATCYVILGSPTFHESADIDLADEGSAAITFYGDPSDFGYRSRLGIENAVDDIDNDGYDDLIIGDMFADYQTNQDCGGIYVYWGNAAAGDDTTFDLGVSNSEITVIHGTGHAEYMGSRLSTGDIDGDGYPDILADAHNAHHGYYDSSTWYGKAYVVFGGPELRTQSEVSVTDTQKVLGVWGEEVGGSFGKPSAGDINGDGIDDLLVQADRQNSDTGKAFVIWGNPELKNIGTIDLSGSFNPVTEITGEFPGGKFGFCSTATDLNNDGYEDMIFSAQTASPLGRSASGTIHIIWGMTHDPGDVNFEQRYQVVNTSGPSATIVLPSDVIFSGAAIPAGDIEIGIFTHNNICAGQGIWNGDELSLTVYGDSEDSGLVTGFLPGEIYQARVWIASLEKEYLATLFYTSGTGYFQESSVSVISEIALTAASTVGVEGDDVQPGALPVLGVNYPNPFNPRTTIPFELSSDSRVSITIYNVLGERVSDLVDEQFSAGSHSIVWDATGYSSGVYLCRMVAVGMVKTQRMMLIK